MTNAEEISLIDYIDDMTVYRREYDTIVKILLYADDALFVKILEEVKNGALEWSDFDEYLSNTDYAKTLEDQFKIQTELNEYADKMIAFRGILSSQLSKIDTSAIFNVDDGTVTDTDIYKKHLSKIKKEIIEKLKQTDERDTAITKIFKKNLENQLMAEKVDDQYISNILFFLKTYRIPVSMQYQILGVDNFDLDSADEEYMHIHNLSVDQIKHLKMIAIILERNGFGSEVV